MEGHFLHILNRDFRDIKSTELCDPGKMKKEVESGYILEGIVIVHVKIIRAWIGVV